MKWIIFKFILVSLIFVYLFFCLSVKRDRISVPHKRKHLVKALSLVPQIHKFGLRKETTWKSCKITVIVGTYHFIALNNCINCILTQTPLNRWSTYYATQERHQLRRWYLSLLPSLILTAILIQLSCLHWLLNIASCIFAGNTWWQTYIQLFLA